MPTYKVTDPQSGKTIRLTGDSPPTEKELEDIFLSQSGGVATQEKPQESPLRESYREGLGQSAHGISQIAFGAPEYLTKKISPKLHETIFPEPQTPEGKAFRQATDIFSLFGGGAAKLATKATTRGLRGGFRELAQKGLVEKAKRATVGGAVYGGTQLEPESTIKGQALKAGAGGVGGLGLTAGLGGIIASLKYASSPFKGLKYLKEVPEAKFGLEVMNQFKDKYYKQMDIFGEQLDNLVSNNPSRKGVNWREPIAEANNSFDRETWNLINRNPDLKRIADNPELASNLTAKEAQNIINKISGIRNKNQAQYHEAKDFYYKLREGLADAFPDDIPEMRKQYKAVAEPYRLIKNKIKEANINASLSNKFGSPILNQAAKSLLKPEIIEEVNNYRRAKKSVEKISTLGGLLGGRLR